MNQTINNLTQKLLSLAGRGISQDLFRDLVRFSSVQQIPSQESQDGVRVHLKHLHECLSHAFQFNLSFIPKGPSVIHLTKFLSTYNIGVEKFFKWFYGCGMAYSANLDEEQVVPFPTVSLGDVKTELGPLSVKMVLNLFTGKLRRVLRSYFRRCHKDLKRGGNKRRRVYSRGQSFLMFKKGSPEMSKSAIESTMEKHMSALGKRHVGFEGEIVKSRVEDQIDIDTVKVSVIRLVKKIFRKGSAKVLYGTQTRVPMPSFRAAHNVSRGMGGSASVIQDLLPEFHSPESELVRMEYHPRLGVMEVRKEKSEKRFHDEVFSAIRGSEYPTTPVFLQEPLKIRTITKGPPIPYWYLKPIQKFLWRNVSRFENMTLTGKPISEDVLNKILLTKLKNNPLGEFLVSGDYSSATDNLKQWLALHIWNTICDHTGIGALERRAGAKSLVGHEIFYPNGIRVKQWNGQMMGSPLSFPILCIANAAVILAAYWTPTFKYEQEKPKINWGEFDEAARFRCDMQSLPFLVNGDDCVMYMNRIQYDSWMRYAELIGMSPSIGKCYMSEEFLEMNSEHFCLVGNEFKRTPFINLSLASPNESKGGALRPLNSYASLMRSFVKGYDGVMRQKLIHLWIRRMTPYLHERVPSGMQWGIPQWLGGLGLPLRESEIAKTLSERSQQFSSYLYNLNRSGSPMSVLPSQSNSLPSYLVAALRKASSLSISVPIKEEETEFVWDEQIMCDMFGPLIFRYMRSKNKRMEKSEDISVSEKRFLKKFGHLYRKSGHFNGLLLSLHDLLKYKGTRMVQAGGVGRVLERCYDLPTGMYFEASLRHAGLVT